MDELDRLEQVYQELISVDYSTPETWQAAYDRCVEVYQAEDIYPAVRALKHLVRNMPTINDQKVWYRNGKPTIRPRPMLPPRNITIFNPALDIKRCARIHAPGQGLCRCCDPDAPLEGQELLIYLLARSDIARTTAELQEKVERWQRGLRD